MKGREEMELGCGWGEEMVDLAEPSESWAWEPEAASRMRRQAWVAVALPGLAIWLVWS